jgi:hypothetical protein
MSLRFAASRQGNDAILARALTCVLPDSVANDNGRPLGDIMGNPQMLRATLLHFARHGLSAADQARIEAERARLEEREDDFRHWIAVCRQLDRRMANRIEGSTRPRAG